jgi:hypothetical protein
MLSGLAVAGQLPWSRVVATAVLGSEGPGDAIVIGTGHTSASRAALPILICNMR